MYAIWRDCDVKHLPGQDSSLASRNQVAQRITSPARCRVQESGVPAQAPWRLSPQMQYGRVFPESYRSSRSACLSGWTLRLPLPRIAAAICAGALRLKLLSVTDSLREPPSSVQSSQPGVRPSAVSRHAPSARPCPRLARVRHARRRCIFIQAGQTLAGSNAVRRAVERGRRLLAVRARTRRSALASSRCRRGAHPLRADGPDGQPERADRRRQGGPAHSVPSGRCVILPGRTRCFPGRRG